MPYVGTVKAVVVKAFQDTTRDVGGASQDMEWIMGDVLLPFLKSCRGIRRIIVGIVYISLLLDNVLLTMVGE